MQKYLRNLSLAVVSSSTLLMNEPVQAGDKKSQATPVNTAVIMDSLIGSISEVLPLSFDMAQFTARKNKDKILKDLANLRENASMLSNHSGAKDQGFAFVAKSLESDAKNLYRWFERGNYDEAKFTLHNMTENCIACHSSLPETGKFPKPEKIPRKNKFEITPGARKGALSDDQPAIWRRAASI